MGSYTIPLLKHLVSIICLQCHLSAIQITRATANEQSGTKQIHRIEKNPENPKETIDGQPCRHVSHSEICLSGSRSEPEPDPTQISMSTVG